MHDLKLSIDPNATFHIMHEDHMRHLGCNFKNRHIAYVYSNGALVSAKTELSESDNHLSIIIQRISMKGNGKVGDNRGNY